MKKIIVTGATGLIGKRLVDVLIQNNYDVIVFSRYVEKAKSMFPKVKELIEWDYRKPEQWKHKLENSYAVIHLAGINLFVKRWNVEFKNSILESRKISTKNLIDGIILCKNKPKVFISASGVGYYGDCGDNLLIEESANGNDFLAKVCKVWEDESRKVEALGVRSVQIRTGLVLSNEDGALKQMLPAFKMFFGGPLGNGKQWSSWIHIDDIVEIYLHALENESISGPINAVSPNPITMNEFAKTLGRVLNRPSLFPVPKIILKLIVGEAAEVVTASQRVMPEKLKQSGFKFKFDQLENALGNLLNKKGLY